MGATDAERQRRSRAHKRGDHSLCDPNRCDGTPVTPPTVTDVTRHVDEPKTPRLGRRGRWLWGELVDKGDPSPTERVLIEEACRLADRLDRLDAISNGKDRAWLELEVSDDGTEVTVVVDKVLSEARQQQLALKQLISELRQAQSSGTARPGAPRRPVTPGNGGSGGGGVADLTARIAGRRANTAG